MIIHFSVGESGGCLPRRFAARQISSTIHLHPSEYLLIITIVIIIILLIIIMIVIIIIMVVM